MALRPRSAEVVGVCWRDFGVSTQGGCRAQILELVLLESQEKPRRRWLTGNCIISSRYCFWMADWLWHVSADRNRKLTSSSATAEMEAFVLCWNGETHVSCNCFFPGHAFGEGYYILEIMHTIWVLKYFIEFFKLSDILLVMPGVGFTNGISRA